MRTQFHVEYAKNLKPMIDLMRFWKEPYINEFIRNQREIDLMALRLRGMNTQNNDELEKLKEGFLKVYEFVYNKLLPALGYEEIKPLLPVDLDHSSTDSYS
jgi:SPX domain protein involved in polyphosphate accumulation